MLSFCTLLHLVLRLFCKVLGFLISTTKLMPSFTQVNQQFSAVLKRSGGFQLKKKPKFKFEPNIFHYFNPSNFKISGLDRIRGL